MIILTWIITLISIIGTVFNSFQKRVGFYLWLISNVFWICYNIKEGIYAQAALFSFNSIMCIVGLIKWKEK
jgi:hypothetical protein